MKNKLMLAVCVVAVGCILSTQTTQEWEPKIGDRVQTTYAGPLIETTITNVVRVGSRSQTGLLVYGDGLPGIDSWWVTPAPPMSIAAV